MKKIVLVLLAAIGISLIVLPIVAKNENGNVEKASEESTTEVQASQEPNEPQEEEEKSNVAYEGEPDGDKLREESPLTNEPGEPEEKKQKDYSHLFSEDPVTFTPEFPEYMMERKTQPELIEGYLDMPVEERYEKMVQKKLTEDEEKELSKINKVNEKVEEAFIEADYNKFLHQLHEGWRHDFGIQMMGLIDQGRFEEKMTEFFPEVIDLEGGYAYGIYFKEMIYIEDGNRSTPSLTDGMIVYKQNAKGQWKIYHEIPF